MGKIKYDISKQYLVGASPLIPDGCEFVKLEEHECDPELMTITIEDPFLIDDLISPCMRPIWIQDPGTLKPRFAYYEATTGRILHARKSSRLTAVTSKHSV